VTAPASSARRTQAERRASSRRRILDAVVLCLAERGYVGTTFPEVLARAGLSNGALWRHFPSKAELMAAAALHAEEQIAGAVDAEALRAFGPERRLDAAVDHFWHSAHTPAFQALIELLRASRSDAELAAQLTLTDAGAAALFYDVLATLVGPELAAHPAFRRNGRMLGLILYGVGLTTGLRPAADERPLLADLHAVLHQIFA
jgi:AcrR family transcriptional regulator